MITHVRVVISYEIDETSLRRRFCLSYDPLEWDSVAFKMNIISIRKCIIVPDVVSDDINLPYGLAVIRWITSCHKNHMTTHVITLWLVYVTSLTASLSTVPSHSELMFLLKAIKSRFK